MAWASASTYERPLRVHAPGLAPISDHSRQPGPGDNTTPPDSFFDRGQNSCGDGCLLCPSSFGYWARTKVTEARAHSGECLVTRVDIAAGFMAARQAGVNHIIMADIPSRLRNTLDVNALVVETLAGRLVICRGAHDGLAARKALSFRLPDLVKTHVFKPLTCESFRAVDPLADPVETCGGLDKTPRCTTIPNTFVLFLTGKRLSFLRVGGWLRTLPLEQLRWNLRDSEARKHRDTGRLTTVLEQDFGTSDFTRDALWPQSDCRLTGQT
ncbi:hypothetical protein FQR65_LT20969 [Abscondita terminalis]|nr:hypothetical protein FQR65_LT20969 [Abscondita terminalis]